VAHRLRGVLRLGTGDRVLLFNSEDGEWLAEIGRLTKSAAELVCLERLRGPAPAGADPWLLFAPLKGGRTESVIEKATELGATRIQPVLTRRSDVPRVNLERLRAHAVEAAEQCDRLSVPVVEEMKSLSETLSEWPEGRPLLVCAERGPAAPLAQVVQKNTSKNIAVLVGPEGGFDAGELDAVNRLPFVRAVGLGPRVLRADTAAFAILSAWQALAGDWIEGGQDARPPFRDQG
jgi:16S rRNA (uracil1498-N3)-methyltransferase